MNLRPPKWEARADAACAKALGHFRLGYVLVFCGVSCKVSKLFNWEDSEILFSTPSMRSLGEVQDPM